ncbi:MAG: hypothetical protein CM1200mP16_06500 [Nitrospina sp.]|nr:MAG: hypothetical protein CM1200mP16_06500 [Nitrospina sp.]
MDRPVLARKMRIKGNTVEELSHNLMIFINRILHLLEKCFLSSFQKKEKGKQQNYFEYMEMVSEGEKLFSEETLASIPLIIDSRQAFRFLKVFRDGSAFSYPSEKSIQDFSFKPSKNY